MMLAQETHLDRMQHAACATALLEVLQQQRVCCSPRIAASACTEVHKRAQAHEDGDASLC